LGAASNGLSDRTCGPGQEESLHSEEVAGGDRGKGVHPQTGGDFVARIPMDPLWGILHFLQMF